MCGSYLLANVFILLLCVIADVFSLCRLPFCSLVMPLFVCHAVVLVVFCVSCCCLLVLLLLLLFACHVVVCCCCWLCCCLCVGYVLSARYCCYVGSVFDVFAMCVHVALLVWLLLTFMLVLSVCTCVCVMFGFIVLCLFVVELFVLFCLI